MTKKSETMTVTLDSCWSTEAEAKALKERFAKEYNVKAEFLDGGDHYSSWRLEGRKDDLKRLINAEWNPSGTDDITLSDALVIMDEDEFEALYGVKAADYR